MSLKHVIFLGAGASCGSGYPSANELRLRVSSLEQLVTDLNAKHEKSPSVASFARSTGFNNFLLRFADTFNVFRYGGFGSVDELSKLASPTYPEHVQQMKRLMEVALSLHNPEDKFQDSEYYPFIQHLFDKDLVTLKSNITVLSYNYDCYLDFLLLRAQERRRYLSRIEVFTDHEKNRLSSGFYEPKDLTGLTSPNEYFKHLKLHGSIAYTNDEELSRLFTRDINNRFSRFDQHVKPHLPPVVFPWELFDDRQRFIEKDNFIFIKGAIANPSRDDYSKAEFLYKLYRTIWEQARKAVNEANKISFVGTSMHDYLTDGLRFLFNDRQGEAEIVVANKAKEKEPIAGRVNQMLRTVAPNMRIKGWLEGNAARPPNHGIILRESFADFIEKEMDD